MTEAVKPAAEEPLPEVYTHTGAVRSTNFKNCDFAVDGSPRRRTFTSPLKRAPSGKCLRLPENIKHATAILTSSDPKIAGAILERMSKMTSLNGLCEKALNSWCSASVNFAFPRAPSLTSINPRTRMYGNWTPPPAASLFLFSVFPEPMVYTPTTETRVPGAIFCTNFRSTHNIIVLGISPAGTSSGFSCNFNDC